MRVHGHGAPSCQGDGRSGRVHGRGRPLWTGDVTSFLSGVARHLKRAGPFWTLIVSSLVCLGPPTVRKCGCVLP
jgi:hypothetical protein